MNSMTQLSDTQIGVCTLCTTVHVSETSIDDGQECENCGENSVHSIEALCDMANAYISYLHEGSSESYYD